MHRTRNTSHSAWVVTACGVTAVTPANLFTSYRLEDGCGVSKGETRGKGKEGQRTQWAGTRRNCGWLLPASDIPVDLDAADAAYVPTGDADSEMTLPHPRLSLLVDQFRQESDSASDDGARNGRLGLIHGMSPYCFIPWGFPGAAPFNLSEAHQLITPVTLTPVAPTAPTYASSIYADTAIHISIERSPDMGALNPYPKIDNFLHKLDAFIRGVD
ncbi:hypothetical protein B0H10DRAFT_1954594 [Mycena sp. CBHHK59/15]|nr:hypothetical protein B0H10DRAFT_1954594 [Mycena sp. CBHHK59/15]